MLSTLLACTDLTRLVEHDSPEAIEQLCHQALSAPAVAAVCCWPTYLDVAKSCLSGSSVKLATVINFPSGIAPIEHVIADITEVIQRGAQEIDLVMPYPALLSGANPETLVEFIHTAKLACQDRPLKVILETGALKTPEYITTAANIAVAGGADFLKTSTGKVPIGATLEAVTCLISVIEEAPRPVGLKVSGGIRQIEDALAYAKLLTDAWGWHALHPSRFRIGASGLVEQLRKAINESESIETVPS